MRSYIRSKPQKGTGRKNISYTDKLGNVCSREKSGLEQGRITDVSLLRRKTQSGKKI